jgi:endo-1,4-beta-xylanase
MHLDAANPPSLISVIENIERFANLGLDIVITELDVNLANLIGTQAEQLEVQAVIYQQMLEACLQISACKSYTLWSLSDRYAWVEFGAASPPILDESNQPKPAHVVLLEKLMILASTPC